MKVKTYLKVMKELRLEKPIRITRSRQHKQVSPNGLPIQYVGRGSKWGNFLKLEGDIIYINASHRRKILDTWVFFIHGNKSDLILNYEVFMHTISMQEKDVPIKTSNIDLQYWYDFYMKQDFSELKGKNLSCWCKKGEHCHADVLLKLVN